jgi:uncharacterized RDD family membrane protein YckC
MNKYDTFGARFGAAIVDGVIFLPLTFLDAYAADKIMGVTGLLILWTVISMGLFQFYSIYMHGRYGQTIGKRTMGVKIITFPEELPINFKHAFIRDLPYTIILLADIVIAIVLIINPELIFNNAVTSISDLFGYAWLLWFLLEIISMLFNDKKRAVHDIIAKTVVIKTDSSVK